MHRSLACAPRRALRTAKVFALVCWALAQSAPAARAAPHPLDPLSAAEIRASFELLAAHFSAQPELPKQDLLFPLMALREPDKAAPETDAPPRAAEVEILHWPSNRAWLAQLDLNAQRVLSLQLLPAGTQPALSAEEYEAAAALVRADAAWREAVRARGADPELAQVEVWAPGAQAISDELAKTLSHGRATRLVRCLSFAGGLTRGRVDQRRPPNPYVRPLDGLVVLVDLNARRVVHMTDVPMEQPVSSESGNAAKSAPAPRPLVTSQPRGSDLNVNGQLVRWGAWQFRVALHPREGLVLYDVRVQARGALRKVAHRLALSEIYVPYGFGDAEWSWRSAFDVGEYNIGLSAHELEPNRDVPENARFLPALFASTRGLRAQNPTGVTRIARAIALYERDAGLLWARTDPSSGARDTRLARELVVTWSTWIGNYIYGFEWIFRHDGSLAVQVQLTGTTLNRSLTARAERGAPKVGKDAQGVLVAAPNHQHFFSFRLDLDVDGSDNHVMESELEALSEGGFRNAFDKHKSALTAEGARDVLPGAERKWCVMSSSQRNLLGEPSAFTLEPGDSVRPYSADDFPGLQRAAFAKHALWVTRYKEPERFAAGRFPGQAAAPGGLPSYGSPPEPLTPERGADVVLWYTLGLSHVPRLEDYPVMSVERIGFRLVPHGFFDRNPALEVGDQAR